MDIVNFTIREFFGILFFTGLIIWLNLQILNGFGIFKDIFFVSDRRSRK